MCCLPPEACRSCNHYAVPHVLSCRLCCYRSRSARRKWGSWASMVRGMVPVCGSRLRRSRSASTASTSARSAARWVLPSPLFTFLEGHGPSQRQARAIVSVSARAALPPADDQAPSSSSFRQCWDASTCGAPSRRLTAQPAQCEWTRAARSLQSRKRLLPAAACMPKWEGSLGWPSRLVCPALSRQAPACCIAC